MADEEQTENEEQTAPEETPAEEAPAAEAEAPAEEAPAEEAPAEEPAAEAAPAPAAAPADDEDAPPPLTAKELRKQKRSAFAGEAKPERSDEERATERAEERKRKAASRRRYRQGRGKVRTDAIPKGEGTPPTEREPGNPKVRRGIVVSDKMDKTITVRVESARRHPTYEKVIRTSKMYHAHDERNEAGAGDTVRLIECRPMSRTKHWRLTEILEKAK